MNQIVAAGVAGEVTRPMLERLRRTRASRYFDERVDRVVEFINANLDRDLSVQTLAGVAGTSAFHFQRQFSAHARIGVARLVRLLRLRRAALRLAFSPDRTVMQIAMETGFSNSESFGRAFRQNYGQSPSSFRRRPRWCTQEIVPVLSRLQETRMNTVVEIVEFPRTRMAAVEYRGAPQDEYSAIMRLVAWRRENGVRPGHGKTIAIHHADPNNTTPQDYRIDIGVSYDGDIATNTHGVVEKFIPAGRCARIRHFGSREYIGEARYLYEQWLPASGERVHDFPPFFHYVNVGPEVRDAAMITDVYLPIE